MIQPHGTSELVLETGAAAPPAFCGAVVADALVVGATAGCVGVVVFGRVGGGRRVVEVVPAVDVVEGASVVVVVSREVVVSRDEGVSPEVVVAPPGAAAAPLSAGEPEVVAPLVALVDDRARVVVAFEPHAASAAAHTKISTALRRA